MTILRKFSNILKMVKTHGLRESWEFLSYRLDEEFQERRLGVRTTGFVSKWELGYECPEFGDYVPSPYRALRYCFAQLPIRAGHDVLLDYGCGMGRAVILAAKKPFRRVIGVELSSKMAAEARANLEKARKHLRCEVHIEVADARTYTVPNDVTVIHLYNPFNGETLSQVIGNVLESQRRNARPLTILFGNPNRFEEQFGREDWLMRLASRSFYPGTDYGIYRIGDRDPMPETTKSFYPNVRVLCFPFTLPSWLVYLIECI